MLSLLWSHAVSLLGPFVVGALPAPEGTGGAGDEPARLVARIQAGDRAAEAELVARFSHGLLLMLRRLVQNPALADDLHQETLSLVLEKIRRAEVREPEKLAAFIRSTARNLFIADRRKEARYRALDDGREDEEGTRPGLTLADRGPAPLDRVLADEEARQVRRLLDELRFDRDRQLLFRFYLSDDSKEAICADLEIEPERFHKVLFHARERLRELWERAEKRQRFFAGAQRIVGRIGGDPARDR
ncbi:MAG TPA: sigma-70 family RNA polymerase sigma factor [Thermoanaerobaculia bacterium]|jgi:RNA polymerase sigma-70 factor (ECF subfamily)|nr:sigma-70 family RNA polymerase sigma factor [Thermoanaerobaculia bacterium]